MFGCCMVVLPYFLQMMTLRVSVLALHRQDQHMAVCVCVCVCVCVRVCVRVCVCACVCVCAS